MADTGLSHVTVRFSIQRVGTTGRGVLFMIARLALARTTGSPVSINHDDFSMVSSGNMLAQRSLMHLASAAAGLSLQASPNKSTIAGENPTKGRVL